MSIKTLSNVTFLLSLSLSVSSHGMEKEPLSPSRKVNVQKSQGTKRESCHPLEGGRENKRPFAKEDSVSIIDIPENDLVDAARKMYAEKDEDRWGATMIRIISLKQAEPLKSDIMWVSFGHYLLNTFIKTVNDEDQGRVRELAFYIAHESIAKKTPGYYWSINCLLTNFIERIPFKRLLMWTESLIPAEWSDLNEAEKTIMPEYDFWAMHLKLCYTGIKELRKHFASYTPSESREYFALLITLWEKVKGSRGSRIKDLDAFEGSLTSLEHNIAKTNAVPFTISSDHPEAEGFAAGDEAGDSEDVTASFRVEA